MKLYDKIDELLEQQCYVVDILPITVPANSDGKYFEIEEFYQLNHIEKLFEKFADIILKCNCYFDFSVNWGNNEDSVINPSPKILYDRIIACAKEKTYLNIIIEKENAMIVVNGDDLYFTLYNPNDKLKQIVYSLSSANGLFFKKAKNDDIHDHIASEFMQNKSVSALIWLINKGREIEFHYNGKQYFISKSKSCSYVSLWDKDYEQGFVSTEMLWELAEIGDVRLQQVWQSVIIDTLF